VFKQTSNYISIWLQTDVNYYAAIWSSFRSSLGNSCNQCKCFTEVNTVGIKLVDENLFPKIAFAVSDEIYCTSSVLRKKICSVHLPWVILPLSSKLSYSKTCLGKINYFPPSVHISTSTQVSQEKTLPKIIMNLSTALNVSKPEQLQLIYNYIII
jgi:hypothetical protein